jgi:predicted dehydrogenase
VILAVAGELANPRFIESNRLAPFGPRGTDVSVVLDLMIHDIDLIQNVVHSPIASIDAVGAPVFTDEIDIANARIRFENGCVADVTASRISMKSERKIRVFQTDAYLSIDLQQKLLTVVRRPAVIEEGVMPKVDVEERSFEQGDALLAEIESFLDAIEQGRPPVVSGEDGLRALLTANRIAELVGRHPVTD